MPESGRKRNKNKKVHQHVRDLSSVDIPTVLDSRVDEINTTTSWNALVRMLCDLFNVPDLNTRSGLKAVHANFLEIQRNLETAYTKYSDNPKVTTVIVCIWAKMSRDTLLRNKIWTTGLLSKLLPLLNNPQTRLVGLQALSCVTCSGGLEVRCEVANHSPSLLRLLDASPDDVEIHKQVVVILSHAAEGALCSPNPVIGFDLPDIVHHIFQVVSKPNPPLEMLTHALELFQGAARNHARPMKANSSFVNFLVALLRANAMSIRVSVLVTLVRLGAVDRELDNRDFYAQGLLEAMSNLSRPLARALERYEPSQSETFAALKASAEFSAAMMQVAQDKDLYALGLKLAGLIVTAEHSIGTGGFQSLNLRTGREETANITGLPFTSFPDALPKCVRILRAHGSAADMDAADIIECKYLIMHSAVGAAIDVAQRASVRSPQIAYFYYVVTLTADHELGLRAAKKGMKARVSTPFIQRCLACRAVEHATEIGLGVLQNVEPGDPEYEAGIAFFTCAREDARAFLANTAPDSRRIPGVINWYILVIFAMEGPNLSLDLKELETPMAKLKESLEFHRAFGFPYKKTTLRQCREMIVGRYRDAETEWRGLLEHLNDLHSPHCASESLKESEARANDNLEAWLEGHEVGARTHVHKGHGHSWDPTTTAAKMLQCSYCRNPSVRLRRCTKCKNAVYCDASCQKLHWTEHRIACKA